MWYQSAYYITYPPGIFQTDGCAAPESEEMKNAMFLMTDFDNLKDVSDYWGHEYGD